MWKAILGQSMIAFLNITVRNSRGDYSTFAAVFVGQNGNAYNA